MNQHTERFDRIVRSVFGDEARLAGSAGTARGPGWLDITVAGRIVGTGRNFAEAFAVAQRLVAAERVLPKPPPPEPRDPPIPPFSHTGHVKCSPRHNSDPTHSAPAD